MGCLVVLSYAHAQSIKPNVQTTEFNQPITKPDVTRTVVNNLEDTNSNKYEHSILATNQVSEEALRQYLEAKHSPLSAFAFQLSLSPYVSTIIAICTIEEYSCTVNPYGSNNLGGLMSKGKLIRFDTLADWIQTENDWLAKHEQDHPTIESLNCYYVQPCSSNWLNTVIKTKEEIEALN